MEHSHEHVWTFGPGLPKFVSYTELDNSGPWRFIWISRFGWSGEVGEIVGLRFKDK